MSKKFLTAMLGIGLALGMTVIGCDTGGSGGDGKSVPLWAQGTWYGAASGPRNKILEITSSYYSTYGGDILSPIRYELTSVNGDTVTFVGMQVKKRNSPTEIDYGVNGVGAWIILYK
ncbi:MAG: hypothetical protein LBQ77_02440 [Treponema sp.]|nr:hypothetical protein [Treponema sp.]